MDRFGAGAKKCDSLWLLGMQRGGESADAELLRHLPTGFRGRIKHGDAPPNLSPQYLLSLYPPGASASGKRPKATGVVAQRFTLVPAGVYTLYFP